MKIKKEYFVIFLILVTEVLGFSLILPFLPFYAQELGASPLGVGFILASFSFFQFFSAPIMGKLSDYYGRKPLLILSQISTFLGFIILAFSNSLGMLFLSRIVDGLFGSNMTIAQAYLSDISSKKDRSKIFAITGIAFSFGFLIGPAIGGFLSRFSYSLPALIASVASFVTILLTSLFLKETVKKEKRKKIKIDREILGLQNFSKYFSQKGPQLRLKQFSFLMLAHVLMVSSMALYAEKKFGFKSYHIGYTLTYIGFISIIFRGIILPKLINNFPERSLRIWGVGALVFSFFFFTFATSWKGFLIGITFFATGNGMARPLITGSLSRSVSQKEQGAVLGVANSIASIAQIISPLIGGYIIKYYPPSILGLLGLIVAFFSFINILKKD